MIRTITALAAATLVAASLVPAAQALTFAGDTGGTFPDAPPSGSNACLYDAGFGAKTGVAWGDDGPCPDLEGDNQDSRLVLKDFVFSKPLVVGHNEVKIGEWAWTNRSTPSKITPDFYITGKLFLDINLPEDLGTAFEPIAFNIDNTLNPAGDEILALSFADYGLSLPLALGPDVKLTGFSFKLASGSKGALSVFETMAGNTGLHWSNPEGKTSTLEIHAKLQAVPLPAGAVLLVSGVAAFGALRRLRHKG